MKRVSSLKVYHQEFPKLKTEDKFTEKSIEWISCEVWDTYKLIYS